MHIDELEIDEALVRRLLAEQFPSVRYHEAKSWLDLVRAERG